MPKENVWAPREVPFAAVSDTSTYACPMPACWAVVAGVTLRLTLTESFQLGADGTWVVVRSWLYAAAPSYWAAPESGE